MIELGTDRYTKLEKIGEGGMAVVYKAYDTQLDRDVAIKVIREQYSSNKEFRKRFEREVKILAKLQHPNIVSIFDYKSTNEQVYYVMSYLEGAPLSDYIKKKKITAKLFQKVFLSTLDALDYAHRKKIVHRDIKPENIFIDENHNVYLTDFGIVHVDSEAETKLTQQGSFLGTPAYASPEQISGESLSAASDIYSLGITFYETISGKVPFTGNMNSMITGHLQKEIPPLTEFESKSSPFSSYVPVIYKMLAKQVKDRFKSCREVHEAWRTSSSSNRQGQSHDATVLTDIPLSGAKNTSSVAMGSTWTSALERAKLAVVSVNEKITQKFLVKSAKDFTSDIAENEALFFSKNTSGKIGVRHNFLFSVFLSNLRTSGWKFYIVYFLAGFAYVLLSLMFFSPADNISRWKIGNFVRLYVFALIALTLEMIGIFFLHKKFRGKAEFKVLAHDYRIFYLYPLYAFIAFTLHLFVVWLYSSLAGQNAFLSFVGMILLVSGYAFLFVNTILFFISFLDPRYSMQNSVGNFLQSSKMLTPLLYLILILLSFGFFGNFFSPQWYLWKREALHYLFELPSSLGLKYTGEVSELFVVFVRPLVWMLVSMYVFLHYEVAVYAAEKLDTNFSSVVKSSGSYTNLRKMIAERNNYLSLIAQKIKIIPRSLFLALPVMLLALFLSQFFFETKFNKARINGRFEEDAYNLIDGNPATYWRKTWRKKFSWNPVSLDLTFSRGISYVEVVSRRLSKDEDKLAERIGCPAALQILHDGLKVNVPVEDLGSKCVASKLLLTNSDKISIHIRNRLNRKKAFIVIHEITGRAYFFPATYLFLLSLISIGLWYIHKKYGENSEDKA